jgi:MinD-like ATPase involved in chromosome partitioning or flagellar assembly
MNITVLAKKGGVGKSTVSLVLYEALRQAGKTVHIQDWDRQGTSNKSLGLIGHNVKNSVEITIYDTPPDLDHNSTATAVRSANIALVVTTPVPADLWETEEAVRFVQGRNPTVPVRVIFNKVRRTTVLGRLVEESAKQINAPALPVMLSYRECFQHAIGEG